MKALKITNNLSIRFSAIESVENQSNNKIGPKLRIRTISGKEYTYPPEKNINTEDNHKVFKYIIDQMNLEDGV